MQAQYNQVLSANQQYQLQIKSLTEELTLVNSRYELQIKEIKSQYKITIEEKGKQKLEIVPEKYKMKKQKYKSKSKDLEKQCKQKLEDIQHLKEKYHEIEENCFKLESLVAQEQVEKERRIKSYQKWKSKFKTNFQGQYKYQLELEDHQKQIKHLQYQLCQCNSIKEQKCQEFIMAQQELECLNSVLLEKIKIIEELEQRINSVRIDEQIGMKSSSELQLYKIEKEKIFCRLSEKERIVEELQKQINEKNIYINKKKEKARDKKKKWKELQKELEKQLLKEKNKEKDKEIVIQYDKSSVQRIEEQSLEIQKYKELLSSQKVSSLTIEEYKTEIEKSKKIIEKLQEKLSDIKHKKKQLKSQIKTIKKDFEENQKWLKQDYENNLENLRVNMISEFEVEKQGMQKNYEQNLSQAYSQKQQIYQQEVPVYQNIKETSYVDETLVTQLRQENQYWKELNEQYAQKIKELEYALLQAQQQQPHQYQQSVVNMNDQSALISRLENQIENMTRTLEHKVKEVQKYKVKYENCKMKTGCFESVKQNLERLDILEKENQLWKKKFEEQSRSVSYLKTQEHKAQELSKQLSGMNMSQNVQTNMQQPIGSQQFVPCIPCWQQSIQPMQSNFIGQTSLNQQQQFQQNSSQSQQLLEGQLAQEQELLKIKDNYKSLLENCVKGAKLLKKQEVTAQKIYTAQQQPIQLKDTYEMMKHSSSKKKSKSKHKKSKSRSNSSSSSD